MDISFSPDAENTDAWTFRNLEEAQAAESAFQYAIAAVQSGQSIQQVLNGIEIPEYLKQKLMRRLEQILQEKEIRDHEMAAQTRQKTAEKATGVSRLFSLSMIAGLISKETLEKIQRLFSQNPQLAKTVKEQGAVLLRNGAQPDLEFKPGQSISAPSPGIAKSQQQQR